MPRRAMATGQESTQARMVRMAILRGWAVSSRRYAPTKGATINQAAANGAAVSVIGGMAAKPVASPWLLRPMAAKTRKARASPITSVAMRRVFDISGGALALVSLVVAIYFSFLFLALTGPQAGLICILCSVAVLVRGFAANQHCNTVLTVRGYAPDNLA